jgi:V8-like Glu-specific endopeptidase
MRITPEKNLAYARQPAPLLARDVPRRIKARKASGSTESLQVDFGMMLAATDRPQIQLLLDERPAKGAGIPLHLSVSNLKVGEHVFPPGMRLVLTEPLGNRKRGRLPLQVPAFRPNHLELRAIPRPLPKELQPPVPDPRKFGNEATTVFPPDQRFVFNDTSYPWCTCGRVDSPLGQSSGVMVGPRHLLTVSHAIQWLPNNQAGWVRFRPSFFNGSAPFGEAWGTLIYSKSKVTGPTIDWIEGMSDYVVVVLGSRIGNLTGWMGSRGYTDSWDGTAYWSHVGYPGDLTGGNRPTFQSTIALDGAWWQFDSHEAMSHRGDVWPGQSGGPFFGWWRGEIGPRAVAVQSSQNRSENNASGGQDMVDLVIQARNDHP